MQRNPALILQDIEKTLCPIIEREGGTLEIMGSLEDALTKVSTAPKKWQVIVIWDGYGNHPHAVNGMSNVRLTSILHVNTGLEKDRGAALYQSNNNGDPSFIDRLEFFSACMRALRWPDGANVACEGFALEDSQWVEGTPKNTSAKAINWSLAMALPSFGKTIPVQL